MANVNTQGNPPPVGYQPPPGPQQAAPPAVVATPVVIMGQTCPTCKTGLIQSEFTACGICLAICCFPVGLVCCYLMRERRCSNCKASFGSP
ncbi:membrane protein BRI3-like [Panulirus ornatus]|uniref:membrane protein BRI3-like n=1 Tax=Panulirus ornatus TaxID=150431 RepID=UPI003A861AAB